AAEIARHRLDDLAARRMGLGAQQRRGGHDLTGLAVSALRHILLDPGALERMRAVARQALDGEHLLVAERRDRQLARTHRRAADVHGAGAAETAPAAVFRANERQGVAQNPEERGLGFGFESAALAVDVQSIRGHGASSLERETALVASGLSRGSSEEPPRKRRGFADRRAARGVRPYTPSGR